MTLIRERFSLLALCSLLMLSTAVGHAQVTTADLIGTIRDTSGAIVPGVTVMLTNEATGVSRTVTTSAAGTYIFTSLQPGRYRLNAEIQGFRKVERTGVELQVNQRAAIDLELEVGLISETVTIAGTAPLLETQSSVLGTVIEEKQVQDLPLSGRNFVQLATLSPGVSGAGSGMRGTIMSGTRPDDLRPGTELFVNGNRENSNNYLYDGIDNNTRLTLVTVLRPNVEAIKEFKVQTNLYSADQGRNPGGQINVVTKSGGNAFHGVAYEFLRNDKFDANNFFANRAGQDKPPFSQNQFGGAIGGPIIANKTFFFADYDGFRQELGRVFVNTVPTAKMRQGDFSEVATIYDPLTTVALPAGGVTRQPFAGNSDPAKPLGSGDGKIDQRVSDADHAGAVQQPGDHSLAHAELEPVRRARGSQPERSKQLSWALFLVEDVHHQSVHLRAGPASGIVEGRGPRQRRHVCGTVGSVGRARGLRLGARVLVASSAGYARRLQPLQSRVHAGRRRHRATSSANSSAYRTPTSSLGRMASRSSARQTTRVSAIAGHFPSSGMRKHFST